MADIVLSDIGSGYNRTKINNNFTVLETVVNNGLLHLDGGNNIMKQNIDMDSNDIINVGTMQAQTITINGTDYSVVLQSIADSAQVSADAALVSETNAAASEVAAATSESNAATTLSEFKDIYWGAYASEPALSPEGNPAEAGDLYFDTTDQVMRVYNATLGLWTEAVSGVNGVKENVILTNIAGQDTFPMNYQSGFCDVYLNGVKLLVGTDYTATDGLSIVLATPIADAADVLELVAFNQVDFDVLTSATLTYDNTTSGLTGVNVQEVFDTPSNAAGRLVQPTGSDLTPGYVALTEGLSHVDPRQFGLGDQGSQLGLFDLNSVSIGTVVNVSGTNADADTYNWPKIANDSNPVWWVVETFGASDRTMQRATQCFQIGGQEKAVFVRVRHDVTWSSWNRIDPQAFGVGTVNAPNAEDASMNNCLTGGMYSCANVTTPYPGSVNSAATLFVIPRLNGSADHEVTQILEWRSQTWRRYRMNGVWSTWQPIYTGANLNPNVFSCSSTDARIAMGIAVSSSIVVFYLPVNFSSRPSSITVNGTFSVKDAAANAKATGITPVLDVSSSSKNALLVVGGLSLTVGEVLQLTSDSAGAYITVNQ